MVLRRLLPPLFVSVVASLAACTSETTEEPPDSTLVVGVQSDDLALEGLHVVATVDGKPLVDVRQSASPVLPKEVEVHAKAGARVEIVTEGIGSGGQTIITRRAEAVVPSAKKLLRMQLESRCLSASAPGAPPPVTCAAPQTCASGRCISDVVPYDQLEEYGPKWPESAPDICRPANAGAPELVLGTGQTDYGTLSEGQTLMLEKGPQGGHHIWIAVRMRNLKKSGSRTALSARLPDDPSTQILPAAYVFSFDRDEGSYCKLFGLRFQLDSGAIDLGQAYKKLLGKRLEVTAEVVDGLGERATSTKTIRLDDKVLCPDGTTTTCVN